jgi:hypothetical protein
VREKVNAHIFNGMIRTHEKEYKEDLIAALTDFSWRKRRNE